MSRKNEGNVEPVMVIAQVDIHIRNIQPRNQHMSMLAFYFAGVVTGSLEFFACIFRQNSLFVFHIKYKCLDVSKELVL